jgi:hypothetical protein
LLEVDGLEMIQCERRALDNKTDKKIKISANFVSGSHGVLTIEQIKNTQLEVGAFAMLMARGPMR